MLNKVLIVEDSPLQSKMYRTIFSPAVCGSVVFAANGLEAMDKLAVETEVDLIILDINMPKMNGLAFLEAMTKDGYGQIPVIVISTEGKDDDIRRALELGARAYIKKPFKPQQVQDLVGQVVPVGHGG